MRLSWLYRPQINDFTDGVTPVQVGGAVGTSMKAALEGLSNIDSVDVTLTIPPQGFSSTDVGTLELQYQITFTGKCVRGYIPEAALVVSTCDMSTTDVAIACR